MEKQGAVIEVNDPARFEELPDGWIMDHREKKKWGPSSEKVLNKEERQEFCLKFGGEEPSAAEAASIINFEGDPCFFPIFADTKTDDWYATKSVPAWDRDYFLHNRIVSYGIGSVSYGVRDCKYYVRPVLSRMEEATIKLI
jgi:hypothetical protein